jgi:hypothetical protein
MEVMFTLFNEPNNSYKTKPQDVEGNTLSINALPGSLSQSGRYYY